MHEGLAQAVSAKRPNKEGWCQAEPRAVGVERGTLTLQAPAHRSMWLWLWEGEQEIAEGGNGRREDHLPHEQHEKCRTRILSWVLLIHLRIRSDDEKEKREVSLTPSLSWDLPGAPGPVHLSKPRKLGSQKGVAPGCGELGVRRQAG